MFDQIKLIHSIENDPYVNLAIEDQLLQEAAQEESSLCVYFYVNRPCVVFGNFQNPWLECDLKLMAKDDIWPVRRQSGGGAVYHDHGNLNFSFIQSGKNYDKIWNLSIIQKTLEQLGIQAQFNERSDLILDGKKFSGSAFKQKKDSSMHHGTLLINANLNNLTNYLSSKTTIIESKSIKSVRSRVINLSEKNMDLTHLMVMQTTGAILQKIVTCEVDLQSISAKDLRDHQKLDLWRSQEHIFNKTPRFILNFDNLDLQVETGLVTEVAGHKDHHWLGQKFIEIFSRRLI